MFEYTDQVLDIISAAKVQLSSVRPSNWAEQNIIMGKPFPGPFRYDRTPYTREIIDCFSPDHPARIVAVMKGAQVGFSAGVLYPAVGWIMANQPGNTLFMVGHEDLVDETMNKIDLMIDGAGIRHLIRPSVQRRKKGKTGDTSKQKEFPGGYLVLGYAGNHKILRQRDMQYGIIDDFESVKKSSKESGDTRKLFEQRFAAYADKMKLFYISTPELKSTSNIEPAYLLGDQRQYFIPCPCCGELIVLHWSVKAEHSDDMAGMTWKTDTSGRIIPGTVGYVCQKCSGFFDDSNKQELILSGSWQATAEPSRMGYYSFHLSSLYAPPGMYDWQHYAMNYIEAHPGGKRDENAYKSFVNLCLGQTYEETGEAPSANELQKNIRNYEIATVPEKMSIADGNGKIVLLTFAADCNGKIEDARVDWEIIGWTETGSNYSICHGSVGTFIPKEGEKKKIDRERWTYEHHRPNSVWPKLTEIINTKFVVDSDSRRMKVFISGIDVGHFTNFVWEYIDKANSLVLGLKGDKESIYRKFGVDLPIFKKGRERSMLYLLDVNKIKDDVAALINLKWDSVNDEEQPAGFMNFPTPSNGLYLYNNYFSHYEAEHRIVETKEGEGIASRWQKKSTNVMNHMWDVRIYNYALKEILVSIICQELKIKNPTWSDYVNAVLGKV